MRYNQITIRTNLTPAHVGAGLEFFPDKKRMIVASAECTNSLFLAMKSCGRRPPVVNND
jgi:hypothetical protein